MRRKVFTMLLGCLVTAGCFAAQKTDDGSKEKAKAEASEEKK